MKRCSKILIDGEEKLLSEASTNKDYENSLYKIEEFQNATNKFDEAGQTSMCFAYRDLDLKDFPEGYQFDIENWEKWGKYSNNLSEYEGRKGTFPLHDLTFLGTITTDDPLRPNFRGLIEKCREEGIKVIMITSAEPDRAQFVANNVGIITEDAYINRGWGEIKETDFRWQYINSIVVKATDIYKEEKEYEKYGNFGVTRETFPYMKKWLVKPEVIFVDLTQASKEKIVTACQDEGHVVAFVGYSSSDREAMWKADIGVAYGSG